MLFKNLPTHTWEKRCQCAARKIAAAAAAAVMVHLEWVAQVVSVQSWVGPLGGSPGQAAAAAAATHPFQERPVGAFASAAAAAAATHPFQEDPEGASAVAHLAPPLGGPRGVGVAWAVAMEETQDEEWPQVVLEALLQVGRKVGQCLGMDGAKRETQVVTCWDLAVVALD